MKYLSFFLITFVLLTGCQHKKQEASTAKSQSETEFPEETANSTAEITAQNNPWTTDQLMPPRVLAQKIKHDKTDSLLILSIGYANLIKGSIQVGPASEKEGFNNLKEILKQTPKDKSVVIYCGCCPFEKCPNIRPAFKLLTSMNFKNAKLLNLSTSIKADWLMKGYPVYKNKK